MSKWKEVAKAVLSTAKVPMSATEIWAYAQQHGLAFPTKGVTPDASIGAQIYVDMKRNGAKSEFIKASKKPAKFALAAQVVPIAQPISQLSAPKAVDKPKPILSNPAAPTQLEQATSKVVERDLHPILAAYVRYEPHFKARVRTIYHEYSKQKAKGVNEWLHPDIVGVYFPFETYAKETLQLQKELAVNTVKFFSFELKMKLDFGNLRESFFQAVSNSSWANEGYLVAGRIADGADLKDELRRLSNAFGIGVICLNFKNVQASEILFPATSRAQLDWATVDRLTRQNNDMRLLVEHVAQSAKINNVVGEYETVWTTDRLAKYIHEKNLG